MTTPPGQEPRPGASRGGPARPGREAGPGWSPPGGDGPRFTPSRANGEAPRPRDSGRSRRDRGYDVRPEGGRGRDDRGSRDRTDNRDSLRRQADRGGADRGAARRGTDRDGVRHADRGRGGRGGREAPGPNELRPGPALRWIGTLPLKRTLIVFFGAAVLGALATLVTNREPGSLLGTLIMLGAVIAALGVERRAVHLLIPLPALTYLVLALLTGAIHDSGSDTSTAQLGLNFLQWIGNGFFSLCAATILVLLIFGGRLLASRQLVSGSFPMSAQRPAPLRPGRPVPSPGGRPDPRRDERRRASRPPWDDPDPWYDQVSRERDPWKDRDRRDRLDPRDRRAPRDRRDQSDGQAQRDQRDYRDRPENRDKRNFRPDRGNWDGGDSRQERRPDWRSGNGREDRRVEDRRAAPRNVPPARGEPPGRVVPPGRAPRPDRDSRSGRDLWDDRGSRGGGGGTSRGRESWNGHGPAGGMSRGRRGSWDYRDMRGGF